MDSKNMQHTLETFFFSNPAKGHCVWIVHYTVLYKEAEAVTGLKPFALLKTFHNISSLYKKHPYIKIIIGSVFHQLGP